MHCNVYFVPIDGRGKTVQYVIDIAVGIMGAINKGVHVDLARDALESIVSVLHSKTLTILGVLVSVSMKGNAWQKRHCNHVT